MCGRFTSTATPEELMRLFGVSILKNIRPRWNVAPSQPVTIITRDGLQNEAVTAKWGLPPVSSKASFLINARMETAAEKPTFRDAFRLSRCIVPSSGWYEWSAPKTPWHIQLRDGDVMGFAGLTFRRNDDLHFVIMTSAANEKLHEIHHRQPLVIAPDAWNIWLGSDHEQAANHCRVAPSSWFNWYRVSADVGNVANDDPGLVTPLTADDLVSRKLDQADLFD
ncbi:MAG: SOS response-associated peptidase [Candidatus Puniceispirillum sp.]